MGRALASAGVIFLLVLAAAAQAPGFGQDRTLAFFNTHSQEHLTVIYRRGNDYVPEALAKINHILRDTIGGEEHPIDPGLLDFLYDLLEKTGYHQEVHIVCGYRSPQTNTMLHNRTSGVALGSLHTKGRAIDIRLPGVDTKKLYDIAKSMNRGGTGYYRSSDFIQIDTGPVRSW